MSASRPDPPLGSRRQPVFFDQVIGGHAFDANSGSVESYFHRARNNARLFAECLQDHQASRRINGCTHTIISTIGMPFMSFCSEGPWAAAGN